MACTYSVGEFVAVAGGVGLVEVKLIEADGSLFVEGMRLNPAEVARRVRRPAPPEDALRAREFYSNNQRSSLDREAQALCVEYNRTIEETEFNDISLLKNTTNLSVQVGYESLQLELPQLATAEVPSGTFGEGSSCYDGSSVNDLVTADVNGDGFQDVLLSGWGLKCALGNGDGTFKAANAYALLGDNYNLSTSDFNGDGRIDVALSGYAAYAAGIVLGNGDGTFRSVYTLPLSDRAGKVLAGDVNGDGKQDLMVGETLGASNGTTRVYLGNGDGSFQACQSYFGALSAVSDLNGDNRLDIVTVTPLSYTHYSVLFGNGNGSFQASVSNSTPAQTPREVAIADFDGDGRLDMALADSYYKTVVIHPGNGDGTFRRPISSATDAVVYWETLGHGLIAADINGDGKQDLVEAPVGGYTAVLIGNGNGSFLAVRSYASTGGLTSVALADINGDGALDILEPTQVRFGETIRSSSMPMFSLATRNGALSAIAAFEDTASALTSARVKLGANLSRLTVIAGALQSSCENYQAAAARIMDADIAEESAGLVRLQILQQAGAAVLAQANKQPALALQLLGRV